MRKIATLAVRLVLAAAGLAASAAVAATQNRVEIFPFRDANWYEPLVAEQRAARIAVNFGATDAFEFSVDPGRRFAWDIHLGRELPMVIVERGATTDLLAAGEWGIGVWAPVSFHMIEDFKDPSNPIINTDYRFGSMVKFRYALQQERWLSARFVPIAHESTHLGDEFSLTASEHFPDFERINVSYEYWEYGVAYETPRWSLRHGGLQPWGSDGYYSDHLLEPGRRSIPASNSTFDPSFGAEYRHPHHGRTWSPFVSVETRDRIVYDYHKSSSVTPEQRRWSTTATAGIWTDVASTTPASFALSHIYFRYYRGVNPHGQLRNDPYFTMVSAGFNFRVK